MEPTRRFADGLATLLCELAWAKPDDAFTAEDLMEMLGGRVSNATEFGDTDLLTNDAGVVVSFEDGSELQMPVVQSRGPRAPREG